MELAVRESEIEDVFTHYPQLLRRVLGVSQEIQLVARQKLLPSGRLDLVFACADELLLVELKTEEFKRSFLTQVLSYRADLIELQKQRNFISGNVIPYLACPPFAQFARRLAEEVGVRLCSYDPAEILTAFFQKAPLDTKYLSAVPSDMGVWRIGLVNGSLALVASMGHARQIAQSRGYSEKTVGNQLRLAEELGLVRLGRKAVELSSFGTEFVGLLDKAGPSDILSPDQARLLRRFILASPFFSGATFGILTIVACVFELSKNTYPVPQNILARHFISAAGLHFRWSKDKAVTKGVRMYSNYAIELGLLGKVGSAYFVTPSGLQFVLLLNMHKSLKFIETIEAIS
jgi:hypothetical protein